MSEEPITVWVCVDCYFEHHGVLEEYDGDRDQLLSQLGDVGDVTSGLMYEEHAEDCEIRLTNGDADIECGCESIEFSRSSCDGCGSHLAGAREALTIWLREEAS